MNFLKKTISILSVLMLVAMFSASVFAQEDDDPCNGLPEPYASLCTWG
jgi:preprotein translocase subunit SecG